MNELLFTLTLCRGIGNLGLLKIIDFSLRHQVTEFTKEALATIAELKQYTPLFYESWDYWQANEREWMARYQQHQFFTILDACYPSQLRQVYNCPALLFYQGDLSLLQQKSLALVGSRSASLYGLKAARKLVIDLVAEDWVIVSGLAKGIDSACHQTAIQKQGKTIGVIGTGLDRCYPKETAELHQEMKNKQLVLSEYPNGTPPKKHHFPMRNRIIAGLTQGTCVIEAKKFSGSLITAEAALDYGREVFAVPGEITQLSSEGCINLIKAGAKCVYQVEDILEELQFFQ